MGTHDGKSKMQTPGLLFVLLPALAQGEGARKERLGMVLAVSLLEKGCSQEGK